MGTTSECFITGTPCTRNCTARKNLRPVVGLVGSPIENSYARIRRGYINGDLPVLLRQLTEAGCGQLRINFEIDKPL